MFDTVLQQLATIAILAQRGVQFAKTVFRYNGWAEKYQQSIDVGLTAALNVSLCFSWHVDLLSAAGITFQAAWVGPAFTGVIASLGSTVAHEFVELLKGWRAGAPALRAKDRLK